MTKLSTAPTISSFDAVIGPLLSIYVAIIYGTLYMLFDAFPIIYQEVRSSKEGIGGCAFLAVLIGMLSAFVYMIIDNSRYSKVTKRSEDGSAAPEDRFPPATVGSVLITIGIFWFVWTNYASIRWIVSIMAGAPF